MTANPYGVLLRLVREHLWKPDGEPPENWSERREGSVLKRLLTHRSVAQLEVAILGLALLRDAGCVDWLKPGIKVTCRALYNSRSGVSQMFELATAEFWKVKKRNPKKGIESLGEILERARKSVGRVS